jgi:hypothetical protein
MHVQFLLFVHKLSYASYAKRMYLERTKKNVPEADLTSMQFLQDQVNYMSRSRASLEIKIWLT